MNNKQVKKMRKAIKAAGAKETSYFHKVSNKFFTDPMGNRFSYTTEQVRLIPHSVKRLMKEAKKVGSTDGYDIEQLAKDGFVAKV